jgi:hypothetical protein
MSEFARYQHVERIFEDGEVAETYGLLTGRVHVFPKLDGANHCIYYDNSLGGVRFASRNQLLSEGYDSTGFWHYAAA